MSLFFQRSPARSFFGVMLLLSLFFVQASRAEDSASGTALASCKKHVESMLKESAETRFQGEREMRVEKAQGNFDISGWVTSKTTAGTLRRGDFNCHASRFGGGLWTTKTSLSFDP